MPLYDLKKEVANYAAAMSKSVLDGDVFDVSEHEYINWD